MKNKILISWIILFLTIVFIYFLSIISDNNECTWVRAYNSECKK